MSRLFSAILLYQTIVPHLTQYLVSIVKVYSEESVSSRICRQLESVSHIWVNCEPAWGQTVHYCVDAVIVMSFFVVTVKGWRAPRWPPPSSQGSCDISVVSFWAWMGTLCCCPLLLCRPLGPPHTPVKPCPWRLGCWDTPEPPCCTHGYWTLAHPQTHT